MIVFEQQVVSAQETFGKGYLVDSFLDAHNVQVVIAEHDRVEKFLREHIVMLAEELGGPDFDVATASVLLPTLDELVDNLLVLDRLPTDTFILFHRSL